MKQNLPMKVVPESRTKLHLALVEPDIAPNVGAAIRLAACFAVPLHVIGPCGFPVSQKSLSRAAMDYADHAQVHDHSGWRAFAAQVPGRRVALSARAEASLWDFEFRPGDVLLMGCETAGLPAPVLAEADARLRIPMAPGRRSLNIAVAAGIALAEAVRQVRPGGLA